MTDHPLTLTQLGETMSPTIAPPALDLSLCTECGFRTRNPGEYHPLIACAIVKEVRRMTGRVVDPLPYLRTVATDMAHVNEVGVYVDPPVAPTTVITTPEGDR